MRSSWKRWLSRRAILLLAVSLLAAALFHLPYGNRITRDNCEAIKRGMTEADVHAILGKSWDDSLLDLEEPSFHRWEYRHYSPYPGPLYSRLWVGRDFVMFVSFDANTRVISTELLSDRRSPSTLPERVWRRLRKRFSW
jgi:hypothetical protein